MFCDRCGAANRDTAAFCRACGADLRQPVGTRSTLSHAGAAVTLPTVPPREHAVPAAVRRALAREYAVERLLGAGGMGSVYLAFERSLARQVAVKVLPEDLARSPRSVERFLREAKVAARLRHPNIVPIHAVGESEGVYYFTMDYIDGETLGALVERRSRGEPLSAAEAIALALPVCRAVAHAHGQDVIHRDLKPGNVMVDGTGHVYVMDFGLAKNLNQREITASGAVLGTPRYMSPEQLSGERASTASDIYSLGLILYFALTAQELVRGDSFTAVAAQHLSVDLRPLVQAAPGVPPGLRPLLERTLEKEPARRPASVGELLAALEEHTGSRLETGDAGGGPALTPDDGAPSLSGRPRTPVTPFRKQARARMKELLDRKDRKE